MKKVNVFLVILVLSLLLFKIGYGFSGAGSGTELDPYIITDVSQLQEMKDGLNAWYELGNDVNAFDTVNWNDGQGFLPVGDSAHGFAGHFDGKGLIIEGLFINRPDTDNIGLFGYITGAGIKDITLVDPNISGKESTGSMVGYSNNSILTDCACDGANVIGTLNVGGLVGKKYGGTIVGCWAYQPIVNSTGDGCGGLLGSQSYGSLINCRSYEVSIVGRNNLGGLVGGNSNASISDSFADASIAGNEYCGGLAGVWWQAGNITNSHSEGTIIATNYVGGLVGAKASTINATFSNCSSLANATGIENFCGGLVGYTQYITVTDCHATGNCAGNSYVGGLIGSADVATSLSECYATGNVLGFERVGGLTGNNKGGVLKSYSSGSIVDGGNYVGGCIGYHESGSISRCFSTSDANASNIDCGGFVGKSAAVINDCFATGKSAGREFVGGFAGETSSSANTTNCYSTGLVTATFNVGGFAGYNSGSWSACFWDTETSGVGISGCGTGKTTAEMMQRATFDPPWNFATIWGIDEGNTYPYLIELFPTCGDPWHAYPIGDLNYDCVVDFFDFAAFAEHWLECTAPECN